MLKITNNEVGENETTIKSCLIPNGVAITAKKRKEKNKCWKRYEEIEGLVQVKLCTYCVWGTVL
jgi:hypothetical protein